MSVLERVLAPPSPLPTSALWRIPWSRGLDPVVHCGLALAVALRHGVPAGVAAGAASIALTELAARRAAWAVSLLAFAYAAVPRIDAHLRAEDFVTLGLVLAALRKRRPVESPLDRPIAVWVLAVGLSLSVALAAGTLARPAVSALTALKLVEYLIAFYAAWILRARLEGPLIAALAWLAVWGAAETFLCGGRVFDRWPYKAESNHVGGFACLCAALAFGRRRWLVLVLAAGLVALSQSRIALVALGVISVLQLFARGSRLPAALVLVAGALALAGPLRRRLADSPVEWRMFRETEARVAEGRPPVYSYTRNRFETWAALSDDFAKYPIVGTGPGSRDRVIYENAYVMAACELGILGVGALLLLVVSALHLLRDRAAVLATAAMLVLGATSISFFLAREAGVWWMLVGSGLAMYTRRDGEPQDPGGA